MLEKFWTGVARVSEQPDRWNGQLNIEFELDVVVIFCVSGGGMQLAPFVP